MKNPKYVNDVGGILVEQDDGVMLYLDSGELYEQAKKGKFGTVAPYVAPPAPTEAELIAQHNKEMEAKRIAAYRNESDPLMFKWQRGEATQQEWLDAVANIKARYPTKELPQ
jgi:hypothetical protein